MICGLALTLTAQTVFGFSTYPSRIPNGSAFSCTTCHGPSGPPLNNFGNDFLAAGARWNATLAAQESDGDGFNNGTELGDPNGTWIAGNPNPAVTASNPGDPSSRPATVTAPTITTQPVSRTVTAGQSASFTVAASGTAPLSYQWQKDSANLAGATSATLTLNSVTSANAGSYRAVVSNSAGSATSSAATLAVNPAPALSISLASPINGAVYGAPAEVPLSVTASGGTLASVGYFDGTNLLAIVTAAPFAMTASNVLAGDHVFTAMATDTTDATATSASVTVTVTSTTPSDNSAPLVSMVAPRDLATFSSPARILLTANASDAGGSIAKVEFYSGTNLLGLGVPLQVEERDDEDHYVANVGDDSSSTETLYFLVWERVLAGQYVVTARATDDLGATTTSAPVRVTVQRSNRRGRD